MAQIGTVDNPSKIASALQKMRNSGDPFDARSIKNYVDLELNKIKMTEDQRVIQKQSSDLRSARSELATAEKNVHTLQFKNLQDKTQAQVDAFKNDHERVLQENQNNLAKQELAGLMQKPQLTAIEAFRVENLISTLTGAGAIDPDIAKEIMRIKGLKNEETNSMAMAAGAGVIEQASRSRVANADEMYPKAYSQKMQSDNPLDALKPPMNATPVERSGEGQQISENYDAETASALRTAIEARDSIPGFKGRADAARNERLGIKPREYSSEAVQLISELEAYIEDPNTSDEGRAQARKILSKAGVEGLKGGSGKGTDYSDGVGGISFRTNLDKDFETYYSKTFEDPSAAYSNHPLLGSATWDKPYYRRKKFLWDKTVGGDPAKPETQAEMEKELRGVITEWKSIASPAQVHKTLKIDLPKMIGQLETSSDGRAESDVNTPGLQFLRSIQYIQKKHPDMFNKIVDKELLALMENQNIIMQSSAEELTERGLDPRHPGWITSMLNEMWKEPQSQQTEETPRHKTPIGPVKPDHKPGRAPVKSGQQRTIFNTKTGLFEKGRVGVTKVKVGASKVASDRYTINGQKIAETLFFTDEDNIKIPRRLGDKLWTEAIRIGTPVIYNGKKYTYQGGGSRLTGKGNQRINRHFAVLSDEDGDEITASVNDDFYFESGLSTQELNSFIRNQKRPKPRVRRAGTAPKSPPLPPSEVEPKKKNRNYASTLTWEKMKSGGHKVEGEFLNASVVHNIPSHRTISRPKGTTGVWDGDTLYGVSLELPDTNFDGIVDTHIESGGRRHKLSKALSDGVELVPGEGAIYTKGTNIRLAGYKAWELRVDNKNNFAGIESRNALLKMMRGGWLDAQNKNRFIFKVRAIGQMFGHSKGRSPYKSWERLVTDIYIVSGGTEKKVGELIFKNPVHTLIKEGHGEAGKY